MEGAPAKSKAPMILIAVAVAGVLGGGGFVLLKPKPVEPTPTPVVQNPQPPQDPVKPAPPKEELVKVQISSDPTNAKVFRAGKDEADGVTPLTLTLKKGEPSFDIQVKLDGYKTEMKAITSEVNKEVIVTLAKDQTAAVAVVAPPTKPDKPEGHHHHDDNKVSSGEKKPKGDKKGKGEEGGADDMKLLTPKF
jgi:hypothetical protein